MPLRILSVNVHVGLGIFAGVFPWLFSRLPGIHAVAVQEASRPRARRALLRAFPARKWHRVGPTEGDPLVGTYLMLKKKRFPVILARFNEPVSKARPPVKGKMPFPQRNLVSVTAIDARTGRAVILTCVHNWHIVGRQLGDGTAISRGHARQTRVVADHHAEHWVKGAVSVAIGDWNERLGDPAVQKNPDSATKQMWGLAHMVPAGQGKAHLDEAFIRRGGWMRVKTWRYINVPLPAMDHPVLYLVLEVDRL